MFHLRQGTAQFTVGRWLHNNYLTWAWFYNQSSTLIFQQHSSGWKVWQRTTRGGYIGNFPDFIYRNNELTKPNTSKRATVQPIGSR